MLTLSNVLSTLRAPLALLFLQESPFIRLLAVCLAMLTDVLDGYIARRYRCVSRLGAVLDPFMDRFFVLFCFSVLMAESALAPVEVVAMLSRDFAIFIFSLCLAFSGSFSTFQVGSLWCGKATTLLQFLVLGSVILKLPIAGHLLTVFVLLGILTFAELTIQRRQMAQGV